MFENMTRDQAIDYMLDQFAIHCDGNDQQAHALATERNAGFASPETVAQATGHLIKDNYLSEKYSFWNIPFGHYATVWAWGDEMGTPDPMIPGQIIQLHVFGEHSQRKTYVMIDVSNGSIFYINSSKEGGEGGYNSRNWKRIEQVTKLWKAGDSDCKVGQNMNLTASTRRFGRLRFHIKGLGTQFTFETPAVDNPVIMFTGIGSSEKSIWHIRIEITNYRDNVVLHFNKCRLATTHGDGTVDFTDDTGFTIAGIEGIY
ncbi:hypothetical protein C7N31_RS07440 [Enterococcus hirae]